MTEPAAKEINGKLALVILSIIAGLLIGTVVVTTRIALRHYQEWQYRRTLNHCVETLQVICNVGHDTVVIINYGEDEDAINPNSIV